MECYLSSVCRNEEWWYHLNIMKLSFVISAYNEEKYLANCLESILYEIKDKKYDVEVIVVNNASLDLTREVAQSFSEVRVVDEPAKGLVRARRAGYLASNGDIVANIDADTKVPKGWVEKVFLEFSKNENLVALSGPYIYYDLNFFINILVRIWYYIGYIHYLLNLFIFKKSGILQGGNFIIRRTAMEKIGGFNLGFDFYGEDIDVATRIKEVGKVKFTFQLPMYTSARRFKGEGLFVTAWNYGINYFWTIFFKKPFSKEHNDFRG